MPFPFYWVGALVAAVFLTVVMTVFGVLLKLMNRAATEVRESILPGLVSGLRDWADEHGLPAIQRSSPRSSEDGPQLDDTPPSTGLRLEHVRRAH
jgi:hypothetical protein